MTSIKEVYEEMVNDNFTPPFKEKEFLMAAALKNAGAHSHLVGALIQRYRHQIKLANVYAYTLSSWEKCLEDFGKKNYKDWNEIYDPNTI